MTYAALVACGSRDEMMLPLFVKRWREKFSHIPLILANDEADPVTNTLGLPFVSMRWGNGAGQRMVNAMLRTGADIVAKFDVDAFLTDVDWIFSPYADDRIASVGIQLRNHPGQYFGLAYSVRRSVLIDLEVTCRTCAMRGTDDDTEICRAVLLRDPNSVYLYRNELARRSDTWMPHEPALAVHCGNYGRSPQARHLAMQELVRLHLIDAGTLPPLVPQHPVWITLATLPHRIGSAIDTIRGMLEQTYPIAGIAVAIANEPTRTGESFTADDLTRLQSVHEKVHVVPMADLGPAAKYLAASIVPSDAVILTIDDDHTYSPQLVERMLAEFQPTHFLANQTNQCGGILFSEAFAGVLWHRSLLDLAAWQDFLSACREKFPESYLADDYLLGRFLHAHGIAINKMRKPVPPRPSLASFDATALHRTGKGNFARYMEIAKFFDNL